MKTKNWKFNKGNSKISIKIETIKKDYRDLKALIAWIVVIFIITFLLFFK